MTPERAKEIRQSTQRFPYWGNFRRFMTPDEISLVMDRWESMDGNSCFADALRTFERMPDDAGTNA
jgi:hypothetical protein